MCCTKFFFSCQVNSPRMNNTRHSNQLLAKQNCDLTCNPQSKVFEKMRRGARLQGYVQSRAHTPQRSGWGLGTRLGCVMLMVMLRSGPLSSLPYPMQMVWLHETNKCTWYVCMLCTIKYMIIGISSDKITQIGHHTRYKSICMLLQMQLLRHIHIDISP